MKDATLTVRLPRATRSRIERLAREEGRSLSQQVERLLEASLGEGSVREPRARDLADALASVDVPGLDAFRSVRADLSRSLGRVGRPA